MLGKLGKVIRKSAKVTWVHWEESGAIMSGMPIEVDPRDTGDRFAPSPVIRECWKETETREVRAEGKVTP